LFVSSVAHAADIKVLSDGPLEAALVRIADVFRQETGHEIKFVFGLSPVIYKRITEGEVADVVIIQPKFADELVKDGKVITDPVGASWSPNSRLGHLEQ
jgi:molybdate transport system substrate-binding protein